MLQHDVFRSSTWFLIDYGVLATIRFNHGFNMIKNIFGMRSVWNAMVQSLWNAIIINAQRTQLDALSSLSSANTHPRDAAPQRRSGAKMSR